MDAKLEVRENVHDGRHALVLYGELDISTASELAAAFDRVCATGPGSITLDVGALTFMDSTGLYAVLKAKRLCEGQGVDFRAIIGSGQVGGLFDVCGLSAAPYVDRRLAS
jgi:anti-sigma B factor antagonist